MNTTKHTQAKHSKAIIGIFGGTFDPIHLGHTTPLLQVAKQLQLQKINLMPAHIPPHKSSNITASKHRAAMVNLVCQENPLLHFDNRELLREKPSYTVDTLKEITQQEHSPELYFFIGMDSLINFNRWYQWQEILTLCQLIVMPRPGYQLSNVPAQLQANIAELEPKEKQPFTPGKIRIMSSELVNISSTQIREKIKHSQALNHWLSPCVINYIEQHQLYR